MGLPVADSIDGMALVLAYQFDRLGRQGMTLAPEIVLPLDNPAHGRSAGIMGIVGEVLRIRPIVRVRAFLRQYIGDADVEAVGHGQLTIILRGNGVILPMIPLLLATPKYLSGDLSLGAVMQLISAYLPFQTAIAWAVDNFRALSNWHASARRVAGLIQAMRDLDQDLDDPAKSAIRVEESAEIGRSHV